MASKLNNKEKPVQVTVIPASPGWSFAIFVEGKFWYQPVIAWKITTGGANGVGALSFDPMANGVEALSFDPMTNACGEMKMLRDPQGVFRVPCTAFESKSSFGTEQEAIAYLKQKSRNYKVHRKYVGAGNSGSTPDISAPISTP
jgi:hypothetical protein